MKLIAFDELPTIKQDVSEDIKTTQLSAGYAFKAAAENIATIISTSATNTYKAIAVSCFILLPYTVICDVFDRLTVGQACTIIFR